MISETEGGGQAGGVRWEEESATGEADGGSGGFGREEEAGLFESDRERVRPAGRWRVRERRGAGGADSYTERDGGRSGGGAFSVNQVRLVVGVGRAARKRMVVVEGTYVGTSDSWARVRRLRRRDRMVGDVKSSG